MDPYKVLGIDRNASIGEIKRAYRTKARKYHPDTGGDASAFQQIQDAYYELTWGRKKYRKPGTSTSDIKPHSESGSKASRSAKTDKAAAAFGSGDEDQPSSSRTESQTPRTSGFYSPGFYSPSNYSTGPTMRNGKMSNFVQVIEWITGIIFALLVWFLVLKYFGFWRS